MLLFSDVFGTYSKCKVTISKNESYFYNKNNDNSLKKYIFVTEKPIKHIFNNEKS